MYGPGDVRVENVPDPTIKEPTDALVRVLQSCICGSDLWPYASLPASEHGQRMGHEFLGVVEGTGSKVPGLKRGDVVIAPFVWSDGTCDFCRQGLQTSCRHGGQWGHDLDGGQGEAVRVPQAQGTLVRVDVAEDAALLPSLLTLSDVFCTGHHAAVTARVSPRTTVTVIGDGAVGLSAVLAAKRLGAERIILMGRHKTRTDLGREFGATDVVAQRGEEGVAAVRELTGGDGTHAVLECVGTRSAIEMARCRPGRRCGGSGRGVAVHRRADGLRHADAQHHPHRRRRPGSGVHRGAAARRARRHRRARQGVRPHDRPRRGAGRLPRNGRPRGPQGPHPALTATRDRGDD
jgi:threonine dehydrogenase-like Zn-dependent dehydrogenase